MCPEEVPNLGFCSNYVREAHSFVFFQILSMQSLFAETFDDNLDDFEGHESDEHADSRFSYFARIDFVVHDW